MKKKSFTKEEYIFFCGYALYMTAAAFLGNVYSPASKVVKVVSILIMLAGCLYGIRDLRAQDVGRNLLVIGVVILSGLLTDPKLIMFFIFIYGFSKCRFAELIKLDFVVRLAGVVLTLVFFAVGLAQDHTLETLRGDGYVLRHSLGFAHPNICFLMVFMLLVDYLLLRLQKTEKITLWDLAVVGAVATVVMIFTNSRAGYALILLFAVLLYLQTRFQFCQRWPWIPRVLCFSAVLCLVGSFGMMLIYRHIPSLGNLLNKIFTSRLSSMSYFLETYGFSIFGQATQRVSTELATETGARALVLDNLYANLLICYGAVFAAVYLWLQTKTSRLLVKLQRYDYLLVFVIFAVYSIVEGAQLNLDFGYFLVLFRFLLFPTMDRRLIEPMAKIQKTRLTPPEQERPVLPKVPKVSIITLTYRNSHLIDDAVASIVRQNYPKMEVIIRDDGSDDFDEKRVRKLFEGYEDKFERILIEKAPQNTGTVENYRAALRRSSGDIIVDLACDDSLVDENVVSDIVKHFQETGCHMCYAKRLGRQSGEILPATEEVRAFESSDKNRQFARLCYSNLISGAALYYSRPATKLLNRLGRRFVLLEDYPAVLLAVLHGYHMSFMDRTTIVYNETGISQKQEKKAIHPKLLRDHKRVYERLIFPNAKLLPETMDRYLRYRYRRQFAGSAWWCKIYYSILYYDILVALVVWKLFSRITGKPVKVFDELMRE